MSIDTRLYPHWTSSRYCVLRELRRAMQNLVYSYLFPSTVASDNGMAVDLGCGNMPYRPLFEPYVAQYIGVDLPTNKEADLHFDLQTSKVPLPDDVAKLIVSTQVLEHVRDPDSYLTEARRLLKSDGFMILSTHGHWKEHPDPLDYWRWTHDGLQTLLDRNGWEIIRITGVLGFAPAALQLFQDAIIPKLPPILKRFFVTFMQSWIHILDRLYSPAGRLHDPSVFVVAAKPKRK